MGMVKENRTDSNNKETEKKKKGLKDFVTFNIKNNSKEQERGTALLKICQSTKLPPPPPPPHTSLMGT